MFNDMVDYRAIARVGYTSWLWVKQMDSVSTLLLQDFGESTKTGGRASSSRCIVHHVRCTKVIWLWVPFTPGEHGINDQSRYLYWDVYLPFCW